MIPHTVRAFILSMLIVGYGIAPASAATSDLYLVRHAETVGNLTHKHSYENDRTLSRNGKKQVAKLTSRLDALNFDYIIVSPKYRVLKTILPYLKKHHRVAEIWPELEECCWQKHRSVSFEKPTRGSRIQLDPDMKDYFSFPDSHSSYRLDSSNYSQGMMQTFMATQRIQKRFAGSGKRVLIVAHYHIGSRILEILQGIEPKGRYQIANTQISHLRENSDGTFRLVNTIKP